MLLTIPRAGSNMWLCLVKSILVFLPKPVTKSELNVSHLNEVNKSVGATNCPT